MEALNRYGGFGFFLVGLLGLQIYHQRFNKKGRSKKLKIIDDTPDRETAPPNLVHLLHYKKNYANLYEMISKIEKRIQLDEGQRGIREILLPEGELFHSAVDIFHAKHVAILTGFPCLLDYDPPTETDGPLGALAIAKALLLIGKKVTLLTDECNEEVLLACAAASNLYEYGLNDENFTLEAFPPVFTEKDDQRFGELYQSIDCLISIERAGPNHQKNYLTMRKRDMTHIIAPLEYLGLQTSPDGSSFILRQDIKTIGIGDGGNEVGMGKVYDKIIASKIMNGKDIACVVSANHLIISSVSNWGGYALAAAIGLVSLKHHLTHSSTETTPSPSPVIGGSSTANSIELSSHATATTATATVQEYKSFNIRKDLINTTINQFLPTNIEEINKCARIVSSGARDGISGKLEMMVDGMEIEKSLELLDEFRNLNNAASASSAASVSSSSLSVASK